MMVRSGPVVAAAVAMLEQQTSTPGTAGGAAVGAGGLRRMGAVSVLPRPQPRRSVSTTDSEENDNESEGSEEDRQPSEEPPPTVKSGGELLLCVVLLGT